MAVVVVFLSGDTTPVVPDVHPEPVTEQQAGPQTDRPKSTYTGSADLGHFAHEIFILVSPGLADIKVSAEVGDVPRVVVALHGRIE